MPTLLPCAWVVLILSLRSSLLAHGIPSFERSMARQSLSSDGYGGKGSLIPALEPEGNPVTVIVLHGLGGNGNEWAYLFLPVSLLSLTYVNFILPTANTDFVNYMDARMPSWFNIDVLDNNDHISRPDMATSVKRVNRIIQGEIDAGIPAKRIFLMGFSQGGALALTTFLQSSHTLGGCMGVATWLPLRNDYPALLSDSIKNRKTMLLHGTKDQTINISYAEAGAKLLRQWGQQVQFVPIKDGPHELLTKDVLTHLEDFIVEEAPGPLRALTKMVDEITRFFDSLTSSGVIR